MDLYHVKFGLPTDKVRLPVGTMRLRYTKHAIQAAETDYYAPLELPQYLDLRNARPIEVGIENGKLQQVLYRISYGRGTDLCLVCIPTGGILLVKTVWSQDDDDHHTTLRTERYVNAPA